MRILRLPAYFYPEQMSSTHLQNDRLEGFANAGHTFVVYTSTPTRGIDDETYNKFKNIKYEELLDGKVEIHRFSLFREGSNPLIRAVRYVLGCLIQYVKAGKAQNIDAIYASSTPPIQCLMCKSLQRKLEKKGKKHIPIIYNLQDIFPDSLATTGLTGENSFIFKIGRKIEDKTYACADKIIVISESFKSNIMAKGVPEEKIEVIPNWIDTEKVSPVAKSDNPLFEELGLSREKFTVVYAGNFGAAQGTAVILKAAELLADDKTIQFALFGAGSEFEAAKKVVEEKKIANVTISPLLPQERVSQVYSLGDVALITCKKGAGESAMPSKTWSIMACSTPIIAAFDTGSELAEVLSRANAGGCIEPENAQLLAEKIKDASRLEKLECNSRNYVSENASKAACVKKYIDVFEDLNKFKEF